MAAALRIPLRPGRAVQVVTVALDGRRYRLRLDWLGRIARWSISVAKADGAALVGMRGLVLGADILKRSRHNPDVPQGILYLTDLEDRDEEATLDSIGVRHVLRFVLLTELE